MKIIIVISYWILAWMWMKSIIKKFTKDVDDYEDTSTWD